MISECKPSEWHPPDFWAGFPATQGKTTRPGGKRQAPHSTTVLVC